MNIPGMNGIILLALNSEFLPLFFTGGSVLEGRGMGDTE